MRFVARRGFDVDTAADIAQEVFLRAWKSRIKVYSHPEVRGWLCKTAKYVMYDEVMRRQRAGIKVDVDIDSLMRPELSEVV